MATGDMEYGEVGKLVEADFALSKHAWHLPLELSVVIRMPGSNACLALPSNM